MGRALSSMGNYGCHRQRSTSCEDNEEHTHCHATSTCDGECGLQHVRFPGQKVNPADKLDAVVVTICDGGSYDSLFGTIPQEGAPGTRVAVRTTDSHSLGAILRALKGGEKALATESEPLRAAVAELMADIALVDNDCVVFNWECCGGCSDSGLPEGTADAALELMEALLSRGSMVMVSDFSLKGLIKDWRTDLFGPNPFVKLGVFDRSLKLSFEPAVLVQSTSSQLQKVGELCQKGEAVVEAMGDTICYTLDMKKTQHSAYEVQVLTVATELATFDLETILPPGGDMRLEAGGRSGCAGHIMLKYPSGGRLLASAGHWVELAKLDVDIDTLERLAQREYGIEYSTRLTQDLSVESDSAEERASKVQYWSKRMLTSSAPCSKRVSTKYGY